MSVCLYDVKQIKINTNKVDDVEISPFIHIVYMNMRMNLQKMTIFIIKSLGGRGAGMRILRVGPFSSNFTIFYLLEVYPPPPNCKGPIIYPQPFDTTCWGGCVARWIGTAVRSPCTPCLTMWWRCWWWWLGSTISATSWRRMWWRVWGLRGCTACILQARPCIVK